MTNSRASPLSKLRKKRYYFRAGDDALLLQVILGERDMFSLGRGRRTNAWEVITDSLNSQGVMATTHSLRCRLRRLIEGFNEIVAAGRPTEGARSYMNFTALERLLAQYTHAEARYEQRKAVAALQGGLPDEEQVERSSSLSVESRRSSFDTESEEESTLDTEPVLPAQPPPTSPSVSSAAVQFVPGSGKKPRKGRFFFQNCHDVVLLNAVLVDEGVIMASGAWKHAWKNVEVAVNSQGVPVNAHTIRTHLRLLLNMHRRNLNNRSTDPAVSSEKQELLREYSVKLEEKSVQGRGDSEDQSFELAHEENQDERAESIEETMTRPQNVVNSARSADAPRSNVLSFAVVPTTNISPTQDLSTTTIDTSDPGSTLPAIQAPSTTQTRNAITEAIQISEVARTPSPLSQSPSPTDGGGIIVPTVLASKTPSISPPVPRVFPIIQTTADVEATEVAEPAWKRQKLGLETILQRFVSEQDERQREQCENERARFSAQQELQRQTIDLQKRALDIQEKAMNMQDRLMALMEKVMDKLN